MKPTINPDGYSVAGCNTIYPPRGQAGEYSPLAVNPYRGCGHGCAYCLSPDTLILKADGTAVQLADIKIGDTLIGVTKRDEVRRAWNLSYAPSRVLNKISTQKPAYRVILDNGQQAVCSADHRWLTERGWKFTSRLTVNNEVRVLGPLTETPAHPDQYRLGYLAGMIRGDGTLKRYDYSGRFQRTSRAAPQATDVQHHFRLALKDPEGLDRSAEFLRSFGIATHRVEFSKAVGERAPMQAIRNHSQTAFEEISALIEPATQDREWLRGWLAGIFDAEGGTSAGVVRIHNTNPDILAMTEVACAAFGFRTIRDAVQSNGCTAIRMLGGLAEVTRFFNLTSPAIGRKFPVSGTHVRGSSRVARIEYDGKLCEMMDITTSTENFIANGMVSHNCYVPKVLHMDRKEFDAGANPRQGFTLEALRKDARKYQEAGLHGQAMISFTSDPFHPGDTTLTRQCWEILAEHGLAFCALTKGGTRALRDLSLFRPTHDAFACTLTSLDDRFSQKWERGAALPGDRIAALRAFHDAGIYTWVSLEPTIDVEASLSIVQATHEFVDLFKVGRVNYLPITKTTDWQAYTHRMIELLQRLGKAHYIKKDLQGYLPPGYHNPLRVAQHH